ncbi:unnamed protein product [Protopolystoma xenopodis]|uniref:Uncharacterized protein n=1 Tax=Protopolystoma xenopodis TaxID=117903 RepID=A0A3S5AR76_9PLAT|nr:unnamed protein product [Protopolystoma xenopodis]
MILAEYELHRIECCSGGYYLAIEATRANSRNGIEVIIFLLTWRAWPLVSSKGRGREEGFGIAIAYLGPLAIDLRPMTPKPGTAECPCLTSDRLWRVVCWLRSICWADKSHANIKQSVLGLL